MKEWNGEERRHHDRDDSQKLNETIIRIDVNLSNFMSRFEDHAGNDEKQFEKLDTRTSRVEKFMWVLTGAFLLVEFGLKFFGK